MYRFLLGLLLAFAAVPAHADVEVSFWSHELGVELPHAFFNVRGTVRGKPVAASYGYTPKSITPAILWGPVPGRIDRTDAAFISKSYEHFRVTVPDDRYDRLMALVTKYGTPPGSTYYMNTHNCVHFVAEAAQISGLKVVIDPKLMKRPTLFLRSVAAANRDVATFKLIRS